MIKCNDMAFVHVFFMDGVGLGGDDPAINPFVTADMPFLTGLLGDGWYVNAPGRNPITTPHATLIPTDANLGLPGRPQSATGQATILSGRNIPQLIGEHYGPKPNQAVRDHIKTDTLFHDGLATGGTSALLTPYPQPYFDAVNRGKRLYSAVPQAAVNAGVSLLGVDDLRSGRAISPGFTGQAWHDQLGYTDIPRYTLHEAGQHIAQLASTHTFSFFEHWPSDRSGHRGSLEAAASHLALLDTAISGLISAWDGANGLLIITSDHGNIEEKDHRRHTRNPVPTILVGNGHAQLAQNIKDLTDIAKVTRLVIGG